jgi:hypothetical protein
VSQAGPTTLPPPVGSGFEADALTGELLGISAGAPGR